MLERSSSKDLESAVGQFGSKFLKGVEYIHEAAKIYVSYIDLHPDKKQDFKDNFPDVTETLWASLEKVGRGIIDPRLVFDNDNGTKRLRYFPLSEQKKILDKPLEVVAPDGTHRKVAFRDMSQSQKLLVLADDHVRSLPEQRAVLDSEKLYDQKKTVDAEYTIPKKVKEERYRISRGKCIIAGYSFTLEELEAIVKEMRDGR